ncbi:hypothetical protein [uncultured Psychroserpens sp.]|uniref:hypothetical protein n=1 Tax=uncultured Psychroserpens sp. TaxID=255436 RepID=UPI00263800EE|nr:hypothetical protein [uncultured Psychroserpens sp.]
MKTTRLTKLVLGIVLAISVGLTSFNLRAQSSDKSTKEIIDDINITIDKSTSESDLNDIKELLLDYDIDVEFNNIQRNDLEEITGISIKLKSNNGQQAMSQMSSNVPINKISFGRKNSSLYVGQGDQPYNMFMLLGKDSQFPSAFESDSIFSQHFKSFKQFNLDDFFNDNNSMFMFDGDSMTIEELKDKMMQNFSFKNPSGNRFSYLFSDDETNSSVRYNFIDDPNKEKVIIIDGETSNFETLNRLAKADKIDKVDILKPETAMSIYGKKAKDGAIIVTTK